MLLAMGDHRWSQALHYGARLFDSGRYVPPQLRLRTCRHVALAAERLHQEDVRRSCTLRQESTPILQEFSTQTHQDISRLLSSTQKLSNELKWASSVAKYRRSKEDHMGKEQMQKIVDNASLLLNALPMF